jgi:hypothetical protein
LPRRGLRIRRPGCTHAEALTEPVDHLAARGNQCETARTKRRDGYSSRRCSSTASTDPPSRQTTRPRPGACRTGHSTRPRDTVLGDDGRGHPAGRT